MLINLTTSRIEDLKMEDLATEFDFLVALGRLRNGFLRKSDTQSTKKKSVPCSLN